MRFLRVMSLVALVSLSGILAQVYGQEKRDEKQAKPEKQQEKAQPQQGAQAPQQQAQPQQRQQQEQRAQAPQQQAQPQQRQQQGQRAQAPQQQAQPQQRQQQQSAERQRPSQQGIPAGQQRSYAPPQRTRQQAQTWQQQSGWRQQGGWQGQATWQQDRSSNWQGDHRTWAQRGGYGGYYIPQDRFSLYFGVGHWFRIRSEPIIVAGYPRFQYGAYWFMMVDPWPGDWSANWYASDDVYIDYNDGYYLYNRQYPGEAIAVSVVL